MNLDGCIAAGTMYLAAFGHHRVVHIFTNVPYRGIPPSGAICGQFSLLERITKQRVDFNADPCQKCVREFVAIPAPSPSA